MSLQEPAIALGDVPVAQAARSSGHEQESLWNPPGGLLVWIVVFVELVTFAAVFWHLCDLVWLLLYPLLYLLP